MLTESERKRYHRQMIISGWGEEGQAKLKGTKIGVVGAGGLGSPILMYLAVAGFGQIIVADKDKIELSNLNRQILHWDKDIGRKKADSARQKLQAMNPDVEIVTYAEEVNGENIDEIFAEADALIDALDNFPSRFLLNEFAVKRDIPLFHGAVWGLEGRVTTIIPGETPCFRCIYAASPPEEVFPVVGVSPALIAIIQVTEAIKYFTGIGELLKGQLLIFDGEAMMFSKVRLKRDPDCPICRGI